MCFTVYQDYLITGTSCETIRIYAWSNNHDNNEPRYDKYIESLAHSSVVTSIHLSQMV